MDKNLIFTDEEIGFLKELTNQKVTFMIVGLAAAALQGAPIVTQDIDLWFRDLSDPGINKALKKFKASFIPPTGLNPPMLIGEAVKMFDIVINMHGLEEFDKELNHTIGISLGECKVHVLSLERIIQSKKATGRQKDKLVLPVLTDTLITLNSLKNKK